MKLENNVYSEIISLEAFFETAIFDGYQQPTFSFDSDVKKYYLKDENDERERTFANILFEAKNCIKKMRRLGMNYEKLFREHGLI